MARLRTLRSGFWSNTETDGRVSGRNGTYGPQNASKRQWIERWQRQKRLKMELDEALPLIARLSRTKNYPRDDDGLTFLAEGLIRAASIGVDPVRIVMEWSAVSEWCPTDADLMNTARMLKPDPNPSQRLCQFGICDGSGWQQVHHMHIHHAKPGGGVWVEKSTITRDQFDDLSRKIDWKTQMVYESRYRCSCHPPRPDDIEKKGKYA